LFIELRNALFGDKVFIYSHDQARTHLKVSRCS